MRDWAKPACQEVLWDKGKYGQRNLIAAGYRRCHKCETIKPLSEFYARPDASKVMTRLSPFVTVSKCKDCYSTYLKVNADSVREQKRSAKYGIPPGTYESLLEAQEGKCAICGTTEPNGHGVVNGQFCVDHDSVTGAVRGLLCTNCNLGLGHFKHNKELLAKASGFLDKEPLKKFDFSFEDLGL